MRERAGVPISQLVRPTPAVLHLLLCCLAIHCPCSGDEGGAAAGCAPAQAPSTGAARGATPGPGSTNGRSTLWGATTTTTHAPVAATATPTASLWRPTTTTVW
jgi:hypothetical protein